MTACGIACGRYFAPIHLEPHVAAACGCGAGDFPIAESASERTIALPFSSVLTPQAVDEVCDALLDVIRRVL